jgi:hypothetical protein
MPTAGYAKGKANANSASQGHPYRLTVRDKDSLYPYIDSGRAGLNESLVAASSLA